MPSWSSAFPGEITSRALPTRFFVNREARFAQVVFRQRKNEREILRAAPGTPLKGLEELEHSLPPPLPTEQGHWVDWLGERGLHGRRICIRCATLRKRGFALMHRCYGELWFFGA